MRDHILAALKALGLETDTQREGALVNVMGRIVGSRSSDALLLTAHLDSVEQSPGATDDGSGVAVLLETARALVSDGPAPNTVMFLFTDSEEAGSLGAKAFIAHHPWARDIRIVMGFDAGGLSGPGVLSATSANDGWLIRQLGRADLYFTGSSAINALAEPGTDFGQAFRRAGFAGYGFDLYWDRRIHSPEDNIENLSLPSLQHQGGHALSLARYFGHMDGLTAPLEPDAVYFSVLRLFVVAYPSTWAIPLAIAAAGTFCGLLVFGLRRRILSWSGVGYGVLVLLVGLLLAPLPAVVLGQRTPGVPLRFAGRALDRPAQVGAVVLATLVLLAIWYGLSRRIRRTSLQDLTMGALVPMAVGTVGTAIALPALSFAVCWPLLLDLAACANWFYWHARQKNSTTVVLGLLFAGTANTVLLLPTAVLGMFDQMSLALLLVGALCGFLVPLIHLMFGGTVANPEGRR